MMAEFNKRAFDVRGEAVVRMTDGRRFWSPMPAAVWRWLERRPRDWMSITVWDTDFDQSYGWDKF